MVLLQPLVHVVIEILLAPQHAGEGLAHQIGSIRIGFLNDRWNNLVVKGIGFLYARIKNRIKSRKRIAHLSGCGVGQTQANDLGFACTHRQLIVR